MYLIQIVHLTATHLATEHLTTSPLSLTGAKIPDLHILSTVGGVYQHLNKITHNCILNIFNVISVKLQNVGGIKTSYFYLLINSISYFHNFFLLSQLSQLFASLPCFLQLSPFSQLSPNFYNFLLLSQFFLLLVG